MLRVETSTRLAISLRTKLAAVIGAGLMSSAGVAQADLLSSDPLYGGPTQTAGHCYLYNNGAAAVTISSAQIVGSSGGAVETVLTTCSGRLAPSAFCEIKANLVTQTVYVCRAVVTPDAAFVRGALDIRAGDTPLANSEMK